MVSGCSEGTTPPSAGRLSNSTALRGSPTRVAASLAVGPGAGSSGTGACLAITLRKAWYFSVGSPASSSGES